jgi:hypothetical protein
MLTARACRENQEKRDTNGREAEERHHGLSLVLSRRALLAAKRRFGLQSTTADATRKSPVFHAIG